MTIELLDEMEWEDYLATSKNKSVSEEKGGPGSGHHGHSGRPGKVGGSLPGGGSEAVATADRPAGTGPAIAPDNRHTDDWTVSPYSAPFLKLPFQEDARAHEFLATPLPDPSSVAVVSDDPARLAAQKWHDASDETRAAVKNLIVTEISNKTGVDYNTVNKIIGQWALTANDTDRRSLSIQQAASEEFGLEMSTWQQQKLNRFDDPEVKQLIEGYFTASTVEEKYAIADKLTNKWDIRPHGGDTLLPVADRATERKVLRAIYDQTQATLRAAGYKAGDTILLFRGVDYDKEQFTIGERVRWFGNPIESWSAGFGIASMFGTVRVAMNVPVENVFSTAITGQGCLTEGEFIIFGTTKSTVTVVGMDYSYEDDYYEGPTDEYGFAPKE